MLSILLTILKVLGIFIASILGLILVVILTVLLVPIRYKGKISYYDKVDGSFRISWLFRTVCINIKLVDNKPIYKIKILFWELGKKKKEKKTNSDEKIVNIVPETKSEPNEAEEPSETKEPNELVETNESVETNEAEEPNESVETNEAEEQIDSAGKTDSVENKSEENDAKQDEPYLTNKDDKKKINPIKKIVDKIKLLFNKLKDFFVNIKNKVDKIKHKINIIQKFLDDKNVKIELKIIKQQLLKLLLHILPTKFKAYIKLGLGAPDKTGMALGAVGIFYGITGRYIEVEPDFDNKVFEGKADFKGRIRLFTILMILLKIYKQKRVIRFIKNFNK